MASTSHNVINRLREAPTLVIATVGATVLQGLLTIGFAIFVGVAAVNGEAVPPEERLVGLAVSVAVFLGLVGVGLCVAAWCFVIQQKHAWAPVITWEMITALVMLPALLGDAWWWALPGTALALGIGLLLVLPGVRAWVRREGPA